MGFPRRCGEPRFQFQPNIAEGFRRRGKPEKAGFMNMAESWLEESRYYLILAEDLGYGETQILRTLLEESALS
jgi:four helix bundle protein